MIRLIQLILVLFPIMTWAKNPTLYYEPKVVELTGVIKILKFPGPPNYSSIKKGDAEETGAFIILLQPVDIESAPGTKNFDDNSPEKNVSIIQLVVPGKSDWKNIKEGNKVQISGTLFHAITGHHHARVLINLKKINVFSNQSGQDKLKLTPDKRF